MKYVAIAVGVFCIIKQGTVTICVSSEGTIQGAIDTAQLFNAFEKARQGQP